ncbi:unannotated protein [freshwater metagenome]|uniref:Unannotated protein n=1 Tax=freshwater metagenome TaxID=449393 RepID=A0A6J6AEF3_9ZZZZ
MKSPHTTTETSPGFLTFDLMQITADIAPPTLNSAAEVAKTEAVPKSLLVMTGSRTFSTPITNIN